MEIWYIIYNNIIFNITIDAKRDKKKNGFRSNFMFHAKVWTDNVCVNIFYNIQTTESIIIA